VDQATPIYQAGSNLAPPDQALYLAARIAYHVGGHLNRNIRLLIHIAVSTPWRHPLSSREIKD
jgi:hypothetical protein